MTERAPGDPRRSTAEQLGEEERMQLKTDVVQAIRLSRAQVMSEFVLFFTLIYTLLQADDLSEEGKSQLFQVQTLGFYLSATIFPDIAAIMNNALRRFFVEPDDSSIVRSQRNTNLTGGEYLTMRSLAMDAARLYLRGGEEDVNAYSNWIIEPQNDFDAVEEGHVRNLATVKFIKERCKRLTEEETDDLFQRAKRPEDSEWYQSVFGTGHNAKQTAPPGTNKRKEPKRDNTETDCREDNQSGDGEVDETRKRPVDGRYFAEAVSRHDKGTSRVVGNDKEQALRRSQDSPSESGTSDTVSSLTDIDVDDGYPSSNSDEGRMHQTVRYTEDNETRHDSRKEERDLKKQIDELRVLRRRSRNERKQPNVYRSIKLSKSATAEITRMTRWKIAKEKQRAEAAQDKRSESEWNTVVVAGLLLRGHRVLLGRRDPGTSYPHFLEFPGGKVEHGESLEEALMRELHEELGITVNAQHITGFEGNCKVFGRAGSARTYELTVFAVSDWSGEARASEGVHSELRWVDLRSLHDVADLLPNDKAFVPSILSNMCQLAQSNRRWD